jgi:hypothetical protein
MKAKGDYRIWVHLNCSHGSQAERQSYVSSGQGKTKGDNLAWIHLDKIVKHGRLNCVSRGQRKPMKAKKAKGNHQARVLLDKMVLAVVRQGGWTKQAVAKDTQAKADKRL